GCCRSMPQSSGACSGRSPAAPAEPAGSLPAMREQLLAWWSENRHDLPWRHTHNPYAILVSEVMLQQTQVSRVVPRYLAWLERWPDAGGLGAPTAGRGDEARCGPH